MCLRKFRKIIARKIYLFNYTHQPGAAHLSITYPWYTYMMTALELLLNLKGDLCIIIFFNPARMLLYNSCEYGTSSLIPQRPFELVLLPKLRHLFSKYQFLGQPRFTCHILYKLDLFDSVTLRSTKDNNNLVEKYCIRVRISFNH